MSLTSSLAAWPFISTVTGESPGSSMGGLLVFDVPAGKDAGHEVEDVRRADLAVPVVADHAVLDDVDLLLRVAVDDGRDEARQLDRVLLILEQLELERLLQPLVRAEVELPALDRERADVVHDLAAEV